jgi:hypothetical protein
MSDSESEMREEKKGLGVENRDMWYGSGLGLERGDGIGCGPFNLVREGCFASRIVRATQVASLVLSVSSLGAGGLELSLLGLVWERQGKHTGGRGKRMEEDVLGDPR